MEYRLNGIITVEADGTLSFNVNVYSKDMRTEYGMLCVCRGELVKVLGKGAKEAWPTIKQAFHL